MAALLRVVLEKAEFGTYNPLQILLLRKLHHNSQWRAFLYITLPFPGIMKVAMVFDGVKIILGPYSDSIIQHVSQDKKKKSFSARSD